MRTKQFTRECAPPRAVLTLALLGLLLPAAGCGAHNSTVLLERDLRMQEDKIYQLQSCLEDAQAAREATIRENEALKKELSSGDRGATPPSSSRSDVDLSAPSVELPGATAPAEPRSRKRDSVPNLTPPTIELPEGSDVPPVETKSGDTTAGVDDGPPTQLVINKRLTGGLDRDGQDGDEGILVVFEPRNAAGNLVKSPGTVSVVLMDPALEGEAARVARWDFSADEVPGHFLNTVFGRGLQFELPWPGAPPQNPELQLFVRFTSADGRKLTADAKINVRPSANGPPTDRQTKRWSPSPRESSTKRTPRSRLRTSAPETEAPRATRAPSKTDSARSSPDDGGEGEELEARRTNRPKWKPNR